VLAHHYPHVPNLGDMTKFKEWPDADIDLLVGGTPCQSFSVAGLRKGLDDPRGNLALTYCAILDQVSSPNGSFGKTSPAFCQRTEDGRLAPSSGRWQNSGMGSPIECLTLSTCEWTGLDGLSLNDDGVCSLSDILETGDVPQRYYLSAKACSGNSPPRREAGQRVAPQLAAALQAVAGSAPTSTATGD
jgi:hypothetical protein